MTLRVQTLGREASSTHVDMLLYAFSGAGKTYRAATAPKPIYMVTADVTGHKSVPFPVDGIVAKSITDLEEVIDGFYEGGHGYATLIVDQLSMFHDIYVKEMGIMFHKKRGSADPDLMPIQGRMKIINQYRSLLRDLVDLTQHENVKDRVHVVFTTLEERIKEDDSAPFSIRPVFGTNKMNEQFSALFSIIAYIQPNDAKDNEPYDGSRSLLVSPQYGIQARDRLGIFEPEYDVAPELEEVFLKLKGEKKNGKA